MAIKGFLLFISAFLAGSFAFFAIARQISGGFCGTGRKPFYYGMLSSMAASVVAFCSTLFTDNLFGVFWLFFALFLLLGYITVVATHRRFFARTDQSVWKVMGSEMMYGISIALMSVAIFATMQHYLKDQDFMYFPVLMAALAYFIPILFYHTAAAAIDIPRPDYEAWTYPEQPIPIPDERAGERMLVIAFEAEKKSTDARKTVFRAKGPDDYRVGDLFYHFMNDYNDVQSETPLQFLDEQGQPFVWLFRRKPKWYQRHRVLNPQQTLAENGVAENTVVVCDRVPPRPAA